MNNHQPIFDKVKGLPVIIVVNYPFTQRDYERYGVETFKKYGMDIQVWDITNIYNKDVSFEESRVDNDVVISIQKISELKKKIQFLTDEVWIYIVFPIGVKTIEIYHLFSKQKCSMFSTCNNFIPSYKGKKTPIKRLSTVTFKKLILYIFKKIKQIFLKAKYVYFSVKPFNIIFGGGRLSINAYRNHYPIGLTTKCYDIHSFDYDIFLRGLDSGCNNDSDDSDYIVFIDQYLPYHPDYTFLNKENLIEPVTYYKKMNVFFESVESKYNMPVVIAEHPRAFYDDKGDPYRGRRMVKNQTNYLIKNSSFVIMHASTAVVFGVLYKKPIVFVSGNSYPEKFNNAITSFAKALNKLPVNLDREPFDIDLSVDEASYQNYKRDYVKAGNNERFFWDQVIEQLSLMSS